MRTKKKTPKAPLVFPEIQRFAVVGTGHVSLEDSKLLAEAGSDVAPGGWRDRPPYPVVYPYEYGWFVAVPSAGDLAEHLHDPF